MVRTGKNWLNVRWQLTCQNQGRMTLGGIGRGGGLECSRSISTLYLRLQELLSAENDYMHDKCITHLGDIDMVMYMQYICTLQVHNTSANIFQQVGSMLACNVKSPRIKSLQVHCILELYMACYTFSLLHRNVTTNTVGNNIFEQHPKFHNISLIFC